jgi:hypothetical protein
VEGGIKIQSITFEDFWKHLRNAAEGVKIDISIEAETLEMQWSFSDQGTKLKIIKLLRQRGAKYLEGHCFVHFWVEVDSHGKLELVKA